MTFLNSLKSLFKGSETKDGTKSHYRSKKALETACSTSELKLSDFVELQFKDPQTEIGIQNKTGVHSTTYTRFNPNDFGNERIVKGMISRIWKEQKPLDEWFIEILTNVSLTKNSTQERRILLMVSEINWLKKLV